jgi:hypothetical protein
LPSAIVAAIVCLVNKQSTSPPSCFVQAQDIGNEVHTGLKPLTFDHILEVIVLFFLMLIFISFLF